MEATIPKGVRDALHLRSGDRLDFVVEPDGRVRVLPVKGTVKELKGILPKPARPVTLKEMEQAIR